MSIEGLTTITQRLWRGWDDPGLPVGAYIGAQDVTGDASGGVEFVTFRFLGEGAPLSGRYYNIEQITTHYAAAVSGAGSLVALNWDDVGASPLSDRNWAIAYQSDGIGAAGLATGGWATGGRMPLFLGQPQSNPLVGTSVFIQIANVLGRVLSATIQGYIWEPRSAMVNGGLRRPVEALYG